MELMIVIENRPDGTFSARLEDRETGKILWGPSVFHDRARASEVAKANMDRILKSKGKLP